MIALESELFSRLTKNRSLPHPTARKFDRHAWVQAIDSIGAPTLRDFQLCTAAVHFGHEINSLRKTYESRLFEGLDERTAVCLSIAMANSNFLILMKMARESTRNELKKKEQPLSVGSLARQPILGPYPGSKSSSDSAIATIVDTIPHCLERALRLQSEFVAQKDYALQGAKLSAIMSIEHNLRNLWQSILWEGWVLTRKDGVLGINPAHKELATLWNIWQWRQEMIAIQGPLQRAIEERWAGESDVFRPPFQDPTVVGVGGHSKETRRLRFGSRSGRESGQHWHATEHEILEASYLASFIDAPLPGLNNEMSCRDLQRAWCVLRDCAAVLATKCKKGVSDFESIERFALLIKRDELERAISHCCKLSHENAKAAVAFFTCNLNNLGELFVKGLWACPLVPVDSGENVLIALAAISIGSTTRRIENWLDRGGLSDRLATARRGLRYEAWVREELAVRVARNGLLPNTRCGKESLNRRNEQDEQIDLLIKLGKTLIVGEVKCLLAPVEPMERFNYLAKLSDAGGQAVRKAVWVASQTEMIAEHFEISLEEVENVRVIPIVVVNQGAGFGLLAGGARVVDFHFLRLYLTDGKYHSGTAFNFAGKRGASQYQTLYETEREAEDNFEGVMAHPPTLDRFLRGAEWQTTRFPMSSGKDFEIAICNFNDRGNREARDLMSLVSL